MHFKLLKDEGDESIPNNPDNMPLYNEDAKEEEDNGNDNEEEEME